MIQENGVKQHGMHPLQLGGVKNLLKVFAGRGRSEIFILVGGSYIVWGGGGNFVGGGGGGGHAILK